MQPPRSYTNLAPLKKIHSKRKRNPAHDMPQRYPPLPPAVGQRPLVPFVARHTQYQSIFNLLLFPLFPLTDAPPDFSFFLSSLVSPKAQKLLLHYHSASIVHVHIIQRTKHLCRLYMRFSAAKRMCAARSGASFPAFFCLFFSFLFFPLGCSEQTSKRATCMRQ